MKLIKLLSSQNRPPYYPIRFWIIFLCMVVCWCTLICMFLSLINHGLIILCVPRHVHWFISRSRTWGVHMVPGVHIGLHFPVIDIHLGIVRDIVSLVINSLLRTSPNKLGFTYIYFISCMKLSRLFYRSLRKFYVVWKKKEHWHSWKKDSRRVSSDVSLSSREINRLPCCDNPGN